MHAANVKAFKRRHHNAVEVSVSLGPKTGTIKVERIVPRNYEVRERSQVNYKTIPNRDRFEMQKRAYIVRKHGLQAYEMRVAILKT